MDKDRALPKEKLNSLTERLHSLLRLSGVDSIVKQSSSHYEGPRTCVARTWQVSLECSHLIDYEGNGALLKVVDRETANLWEGVFYF